MDEEPRNVSGESEEGDWVVKFVCKSCGLFVGAGWMCVYWITVCYCLEQLFCVCFFFFTVLKRERMLIVCVFLKEL